VQRQLATEQQDSKVMMRVSLSVRYALVAQFASFLLHQHKKVRSKGRRCDLQLAK
jgi:hypothetical protein